MKCLTLCLILVSGAAAQQWTQTVIGWGTAQAGAPTKVWAWVGPAPVEGGTVSFRSNFEPVGNCQAVAVVERQAICTITFPKTGPYLIDAVYSGTEKLAGSSARASIQVSKLVPTPFIVRKSEPPDKVIYGNNLIVSALFMGWPGVVPTGPVRFFENGRLLAYEWLWEDKQTELESGDSAARALINLTLPAGPHAIQAFYDGDEYYRPSQTALMTFEVVRRDPVIAISSTPAQLSQSVVVTASVTALRPTGTVTFERAPGCGTVPIDSQGVARCTTTWGQFGDFPVTAKYSGDSNLNPGAETLFVKVSKVAAGIFLATAPERPVFGQTVKVSALLMGAPGLSAPVGQMLFADGTAQRGASGFDAEGRASWSASFPAGPHTVTASFSGDMLYAASQRSIAFVVTKADTTTTLDSGAGGVFTATVGVSAPGSGTPTGIVRFRRDGAPVTTAALKGNAATFATTAAGTITAEYLGDTNFNGSWSWATVAAPAAAVTLTSDRNPSLPGQSATLSATVAPSPGTAAPSGTVQFTVDGAAIGTVPWRAEGPR